jgi:hypothetical protein
MSTTSFHRAALLQIACLSGLPLSAHAAGGPENALVVVNADSWASMAVANAYIDARGIPQSNVVYLRDIPSFERVSVDEFRQKILQPVVRTAELRGIARQIDYVLYSSDFPTAVDVSSDMAGKQFPKVITQPASSTGLTFFYQFTLAKNPGYLGMNTNLYFRQIAQTPAGPRWPDDEMARYQRATKVLQDFGARREQERQAKEKEETEAKKAGRIPFVEKRDPDSMAQEFAGLRAAGAELLALKEKHPGHTELLYNIACLRALLGEPDAAVEALREAMEHGWWDMAHARRDPDLRSLQERADFKLLDVRVNDVKFDLWPTSGFRSSVGWSPNGQPVAIDKGFRYLLPTVLAQTSGRGLSVPESIEHLRRSIAADGSRPKGTIYFMQNGDVRSTTREWGFARAAEKLGSLGIATSIEKGTVPIGKNDIAGAVVGIADFDWSKTGSSILPGAICEHLTSFGGALEEGAGQTPLAAFLRAGAAGASGAVTEPYALQAKFPTPFIHWHYAQGCTLAEAFYQSVAAPYQLIVIGDALCAPWKKRIIPVVSELAPESVVKGQMKFTPTFQTPDGIAPAVTELLFNGRKVAIAKPGEPLIFDTTIAPDGRHEFVVNAVGADALATQGSVKIPLNIRNRESQIAINAPSGDWPWNKTLALEANAPGAMAIAFFHNLRELGRMQGETGSLNIDPKTLGQGKVRILAVAIFGGAKETWSAPVELNVTPPKPLAASSVAAGQKLEPGFRVIPAGQPGVVMQDSAGDWLKKAGVASNSEFSVEGWFEVESDDVYQFQIRGPERLSIAIDGQPLEWPRGTAWWFVPVSLAKGLHRVRIEGKATGEPFLDVRFGGKGTRRLNGATFRHSIAQ